MSSSDRCARDDRIPRISPFQPTDRWNFEKPPFVYDKISIVIIPKDNTPINLATQSIISSFTFHRFLFEKCSSNEKRWEKHQDPQLSWRSNWFGNFFFLTKFFIMRRSKKLVSFAIDTLYFMRKSEDWLLLNFPSADLSRRAWS